MTSPYSPPAELVERAARGLMRLHMPYIKNAEDLPIPKAALDDARACLAASGLGEAVEVLRKALSLVDDFKVATDTEKAIAEEIRALLARLDTRTSEGGVRQ